MLFELAAERTETLGVGVKMEEEGETGREASKPQGLGLLSIFGGGAGDLLRFVPKLLREVVERLVMLRPAREGRLPPCWLFWSYWRMALPWARRPRPSTSSW